MPPPVVGLARPAASPTATHAIGVGALHRRERQQLQARAAPRRAPLHGARRARRAYVAEPRSPPCRSPSARRAPSPTSPRVNGTIHANPRGARRPVQIDLDVVHARERRLELRALQIGARHAEAELTVEAVLRAAGQDADAAADRVVGDPPTATRAVDAAGVDVERRCTRAPRSNRRAGGGARSASARSNRPRSTTAAATSPPSMRMRAAVPRRGTAPCA